MKNRNYNGLSSQKARELFLQFGKNTIEEKHKFSPLILLISQYKNLITLILILAAVFSIVIQQYVDALFIGLVFLLNGVFGFFQEYRAERTLEKLKMLIVHIARVVRDGSETTIDAKELVPGDLCILQEGDRIPADGKIAQSIGLEVDEAIFTGESIPTDKHKEDIVLSGTYVTRGRGEMKVEKTGLNTQLGEIAQEIEKIKKSETPLSKNLAQLGRRIAAGAFMLSALLVFIGVMQGRDIEELIITSISLAVAVIPEGLPLVVTVALAVGAYRMVREKTIVRKMTAIETLGTTNIILTDKTGTLTQNDMSVKKFWCSDPSNMPLLLRSAILGNSAQLVLAEERKQFEVVGDKTDSALLSFVKDHVKNIEDFRNEGKIIFEKPFDPLLKTIEIDWEYKGENFLFIRGAPENIIAKLDEKERIKIEKKFDEFAKEGLRVIGFAYKVKHAFTSLGLVGIYDPPRKEAAETIKKAKQSGLEVVMFTGDSPQTAKSIAEEIGLIEENELVLTSLEIQKLSDDDLEQMLPRVRIFARMLPKDKLRLVSLYKKTGKVVAVTGDGVNDALALKESNIGVAMGKMGTDVAKEASDIVITDDNLSTIIKAIEEGRTIFENIIKSVLFLLSTNVSEFLIIFLGTIFGLPIPLSTTQILWINLISDGVPALALATDIKRKNILGTKPRDVREAILSNKRIWDVGKITIPFSLILIIIYFVSLQFYNYEGARMIVFNALVIGEMIIIFIIRGGFYPFNRFLFISVIVTLLLQLLITINTGLRSIFL